MKNTIKNKILLICPTCERVKLADRQKEDLDGSIFVEMDCPACSLPGNKEYDKTYYGKSGEVSYDLTFRDIPHP